MLFLTSVVTSIMYVLKVIKVVKYHRAPPSEYIIHALPAVRKYKIWNTLFGLSHLACFSIFLTHAGRVCSGWKIGTLTENERADFDNQYYLLVRGGYFVVATIFGFGNLIGFLIAGRKADN